MSQTAQKRTSLGPLPSSRTTPEAMKARTRKRRGYEKQEHRVLDQARTQLAKVAAELAEAPRDLPDSTTLKDAYDCAMQLVARGDWDGAREKLFALAIEAAGWCARIDLAHARESEPIPCRLCGGPVVYSGRGRVPQKCEGCR